MKKIIGFIVIGVFLGTAALAFSDDEKGGPMGEMKGPMMDKGMMGKGMMGDGMMGKMRGMMMHGMMKVSMVATPDGGVIVLSGHTLTKYDKNLNVVKEVELKCCEGMEKCPMMGKGMKDDGDDDEDDASQGSAQEKAEHESHHK